MKKTGFTLCEVLLGTAIVAMLAILGPIHATAGSVYDRSAVGTIATNGTATWTNDLLYSAVQLVRIDCLAMDYTSDTVTVSRVTAADTKRQTNELVRIACSSNYGGSNIVDSSMILGTESVQTNSTSYTRIPVYLKYGDLLTFTSSKGSNGYYQVEYLQQKH